MEPPEEAEEGKLSGELWRGAIESLSQDGLGVGSAASVVDGREVRRPIFIPYTVPGDEVEARIVGQRGKYLFAAAQRLLKASPERVAPPCPHFGVCGGCGLEHVSYEAQLREKARMTEFLLTRRGVALPHPLVTLPAKERHNYRRRARIALRMGDGRVVAGFRKARSHEIVPVTACFIVAKEIVELIVLLNAARYGGADETPSEELEITAAVGEGAKLGLHVPLDSVKDREAVKRFFDILFGEHRALVANLFFEERDRVKVAGQVQEHLTYAAAGFHYSFLPESFIQANVAANEALIGKALEYATRGLREGAREGEDGGGKEEGARGGAALDLYAGIGNLSLPLARRFGQVVAVEGERRSSQLCAINAARNRVGNVAAVNESVERYLREYARYARKGKGKGGAAGKGAQAYPLASVIVLDPPRTGCSDAVVEGLLHSEAARLVYVSCDPSTLARDLAALGKKYAVADICCVDMFPDISHVETVVLLERKGA